MKKLLTFISLIIIVSTQFDFGAAMNNLFNKWNHYVPNETQSTPVQTPQLRPDYFYTEEYKYSIVDSGIKIERYLGDDIHVEIPGEIDGLPVTVLGRNSFYQKKDMESVLIPESVIELENAPFYRCYSLKKVFLPKNIKYIDSNPFFRCITEIKVDEKNESFCVVDGVLYSRDKTVLISYPEGRSCVTYAVPDGVLEIGSDAFGYWPLIDRVYFPASVTKFPPTIFCCRFEQYEVIAIVEKGSAAETYVIENHLKFQYNES